MDYLQYYDKALSIGEIKQIFNNFLIQLIIVFLLIWLGIGNLMEI